jgi:glycosidase
MKRTAKPEKYFPYEIQINRQAWERLGLDSVARHLPTRTNTPDIIFCRHVANALNKRPEGREKPVKAGNVYLYALLTRIFRYLFNNYNSVKAPQILEKVLDEERPEIPPEKLRAAMKGFVDHFPDSMVIERTGTALDYISGEDPGNRGKKMIIMEFLILGLSRENPALGEFHELFDDTGLVATTPFENILNSLEEKFENAPPYEPFEHTVMEVLRMPIKFSPSSLAGQLEYIRTNWSGLLPLELLSEMLLGLDILREEEREWWGGPGEPQVLEFGKAGRAGKGYYDYPEYERFSADADWMSNVVMIAKMVYVWLDQLSRYYGRDISRLDQIPDAELDRLAGWGFNTVWLIGVWERSPSSQRLKQLSGNPEAVSSAYSLYDYTIASDLGGEAALDDFKERAWRRGIRLASDMVPNHTGIFSRWTREHPDWFIQLDYPPYPSYSFTGSDLSFSPDISIRIEDGYWDRSDAAVVFQHVDNGSGRTRYIYHGNDGTSTPWNDTAQLNFLIPEVREAVIRTIIHVARQFPIIRFDAAMTLAKKHYQRLWYPQPGHGSGVPSRAEHGMSRDRFDELFPNEFWREVVDRMAVEAPDTLLLAEAFWLMEGYFVRTLGMHRVYNSAFMNMLKMEENAKYRQTVKNILEFNPEILKRFVNFMSNPDERTAIDQFGKEGKYFGAAVLLTTMPGLPMFGHGQIEGFTEKYGMEYRRAYWQEEIDWHLVAMHENRIFPLMKRRRLFSGSENFVLYDFFAGDHVDENVFAYSNRVGNERALIFYHNRYASTAGWIRMSSAAAVKDEQGQSTLVRKTLGEALGFNPDGRYYYAFRDYSSRLEYLRHGKELSEKGMYVELEAYEYHVFLDFREIRDDDYGTWGKLCRQLQGRPVDNLDEEAKQIRYASVIDPFRKLCIDIPERLDILLDPDSPADAVEESLDFFRESLIAFLTALGDHTGHRENIGIIAGKIVVELEFCRKITVTGKGKYGGSKAAGFFQSVLKGKECRFNRFFLAIFLILHRITETTGSEDFAGSPESWLAEFGLNSALRKIMHEFMGTGPAAECPWSSGTEVLLIALLLSHQAFFAERDEKVVADRISALFDDEKARQFLLVHWSNGVEWFNKERFVDLVRWLGLTNIISRGPETADEKILRAMISRIYDNVIDLFAKAETAHYRTDIFREMQRPAAR